MEATRGNGYAPAWGSLVMMMMIVLGLNKRVFTSIDINICNL